MKYKNKIYLLLAFLIFSACEIKWDMNVEFNDNFSVNIESLQSITTYLIVGDD